MNPNQSYRRKQYFVMKGLQFRFARFVVLFALLSSLVTVLTGATIFYTTFSILGDKLAAVYPQGRLVAIFRSVHIAVLISFLIILPIIFYASILFSHRIAGPLPKILEALRQIGQGNFNVNLVLRKHDELKELADTVNETANNLKQFSRKGP